MITKQMIFEAAQRLAAKKSLDKITVKDITEECQITRQTFYYHFQDIFAMLEWGFQTDLERLVEKGNNAKTIEEALLIYCEAVMEKKTFFSKFITSRYGWQMIQWMEEHLKQYMIRLLQKKAMAEDQSVKDLMFLVEYHAGAISAMLGSWLQKKDVDLKDGVSQIVKVVCGEIHG